MYAVTARRTRPGTLSPNGTSQTFTWSPSLFTIKWAHDLAGHGALVSRLQRRAQDILRNDPTVISVTTLEY